MHSPAVQNREYLQIYWNESSIKGPKTSQGCIFSDTHLILMLHCITFPARKCLGITRPIRNESFFLLFREWLACRRRSKYDFTSTYGNPLFLEHFHTQTNICFSKRSKTSITSKAVCPAAGLPAKGLKQLCQCYPLVTALQQNPLLTAIFHPKKYWRNNKRTPCLDGRESQKEIE